MSYVHDGYHWEPCAECEREFAAPPWLTSPPYVCDECSDPL